LYNGITAFDMAKFLIFEVCQLWTRMEKWFSRWKFMKLHARTSKAAGGAHLQIKKIKFHYKQLHIITCISI
jgi:hypothetical protein